MDMCEKRLLPLVLLVLVVAAGCPQGADHQQPIDTSGTEVSASEELKGFLTDMAESGVEVPGMDMITIEEMVPANLKEDFEALKAALADGNAEEAKTKAKEMLGKL